MILSLVYAWFGLLKASFNKNPGLGKKRRVSGLAELLLAYHEVFSPWSWYRRNCVSLTLISSLTFSSNINARYFKILHPTAFSSGEFLVQACPAFYVVGSTSVDYFLHVGKMKFNTQNEEWLGLSACIIIRLILLVDLFIHRVQYEYTENNMKNV